ncbi:hypothetical protein Tco_1279832, partial [Tanacetum coccineum]
MYCPPSKTTKQLEEIRNFKQEGDETLYQAWETMADHSQKWHDSSSSSNVDSSSNTKGITAISHGALDLGSQGVFFIVFILNGIEKEQQQHQ